MPDEPVRVREFHSTGALQAYLNVLAKDSYNRYDLKFLTEVPGHYTAVFIYVPEE